MELSPLLPLSFFEEPVNAVEKHSLELDKGLNRNVK